jgi:Flp pilus assembly protein TadD
LGGTIRSEGTAGRKSHVRIMPKLTLVRDGTLVWAEVYDRVLEDILKVQTEIATAVISEIGITLSEPARLNMERMPTTNLDAYQAYLRGSYHSASVYRPEGDQRLGLQMFERAVQLDPGFALAWAEIGRVRATLYLTGYDRSERCRTEARLAVERALQLDPESPRVHYVVGLYHYWCHRNYEAALAEFARARATRGDWAELRTAEGYVLRRAGRWEEALDSLHRAAEMDPRGWVAWRELGVTCLTLRRYEEAERYLSQAVALAPDEPEMYGFLAETYWGWTGDTRKARLSLEAMPRASDPLPMKWWFWQEVYEGRAQAALDRMHRSPLDVIDSQLDFVTRDFLIAWAASFLGRKAEARQGFQIVANRVEARLRERPDDFSLHSTLGLCLAKLGRQAEALREGRRAAELMPLARDAVSGEGPVLALATIHAMGGEAELACQAIESLLAVPSRVSAPLLALDPTWAPIREKPCFRALLRKRDPASSATPPEAQENLRRY